MIFDELDNLNTPSQALPDISHFLFDLLPGPGFSFLGSFLLHGSLPLLGSLSTAPGAVLLRATRGHGPSCALAISDLFANLCPNSTGFVLIIYLLRGGGTEFYRHEWSSQQGIVGCGCRLAAWLNLHGYSLFFFRQTIQLHTDSFTIQADPHPKS